MPDGRDCGDGGRDGELIYEGCDQVVAGGNGHFEGA
jgi:hypothetical protein